MRLVDKPYTFPQRCAAIPYMGQTKRCRWVDTGTELPASVKDTHVYLSEPAVVEAARLLGFPDRAEHSRLKRDLASVSAELEQVAAERNELRLAFEAIDALESAGLRARKKAGRPVKKPEGAAA